MEELDCSHNKNITNINHLANALKEFDCRGRYCGIDRDDISELKILRPNYLAKFYLWKSFILGSIS